MSERRRVLQLSPRLPLPLDDGGRIATWNLSRCLHRNGYEIDLVCHASEMRAFREHKSRLESVFASVSVVAKNMERQYPLDLARALLTGTSYFALKFNTKAYASHVQNLLREHRYDAVLVDGAFMGVYLPLLKSFHGRFSRIILRQHNVEAEILRRMSARESNPLFRRLLAREAQKFGEYEAGVMAEVDEVRAITVRDAEIFRKAGVKNVSVLSPFIDVDGYQPDHSAEVERYSIVHIGSLAWPPNANGIRWFVDEVWPKVATKYGEARLYLVGKNPPRWLQQRNDPRIIVTGHVDDERPFIRRAHVCIVPLFEGSGIRMKILTAMAMGRISLSTTLGAEGIDWSGLKLADDLDGWLEALDELFATPPKVSEEAAQVVRERYDWRRAFIL